MTTYRKVAIIIIVSILLVLFTQVDLLSQCPMCRMSAESNLKNGGTAAKGLNNGILYIFAMPYLLVGIIALAWWKNKKKAENQALDEELKEMISEI